MDVIAILEQAVAALRGSRELMTLCQGWQGRDLAVWLGKPRKPPSEHDAPWICVTPGEAVEGQTAKTWGVLFGLDLGVTCDEVLPAGRGADCPGLRRVDELRRAALRVLSEDAGLSVDAADSEFLVSRHPLYEAFVDLTVSVTPPLGRRKHAW